ncbi:hypothetical protein ACFFYR_30210 [Paraburkholderia dipogonis]|uniref:hypothetical protein n=1 Tax=Paraburkholderia dipogonis TaxID=1211383 RepID=UPI0035E8D546
MRRSESLMSLVSGKAPENFKIENFFVVGVSGSGVATCWSTATIRGGFTRFAPTFPAFVISGATPVVAVEDAVRVELEAIALA